MQVYREDSAKTKNKNTNHNYPSSRFNNGSVSVHIKSNTNKNVEYQSKHSDNCARYSVRFCKASDTEIQNPE